MVGGKNSSYINIIFFVLSDFRDKDESHRIILTAAHCITHSDTGYIQKVECVRVRVPKLRLWEDKPNRARHGENDERFYNFIVQPDQLHFFPDYKDVGNPNTGDDLGLIQLTKEVINILDVNCIFWPFPLDKFSMEYHLGNYISY